MKVSKAIEILTIDERGVNRDMGTDASDALKLGIEALKVLKDVRPTGYGAIDDPLPGETPEEEVEHD